VCSAGSYCPPGTHSGGDYLCPAGTYGARAGLTNLTDCSSCPAGYYCGSTGLTQPSGKCAAGYYCGGGSFSAHPLAVQSEGRGSSGSSGITVSPVGERCVSLINTTMNDLCPPG
jgi:hypothetical protein